MEKLENEIFGFGSESDNKVEKTSDNFNYDSISGLGESDYENDDLFNNDEMDQSVSNDGLENPISESNNASDNQELFNVEVDNDVESVNDGYSNSLTEENNYIDDSYSNITSNNEFEGEDLMDSPAHDITLRTSQSDSRDNESETDEPKSNIKMSDTDIEEIKSLTNYKEEQIDKTDINALFERVSVNVKDASEIFKKNSEMKEKIDSRFEELKLLQAELEKTKKEQMEEINSYKKEVFNKLNSKKIEIEKRLNTLKDLQASLEKEKTEFEQYRKSEQERIDKVQREVQTAYDDRREELSNVEESLRKQKDALDEERNQLSLDRIQYETDKNDLANNILKFNELVDSFTNSVNEVNG